MANQITSELIIMKNILFLVQKSQKSILSQRNLLNKWFQDSIKNYIMEQTASSLIARELQCDSSAEVKQFIRKNIDKSKPKYMGIIELYFFYINKFNKGQAFIEKLNEIILNPQDITYQENSYNNLKIVRKQFVCYLILKFFDSYGKTEILSFYELWNECFPQEIQTKKKLSKFDKKEEKKIIRRQYIRKTVKENLSSSQNLQSSTTSLNFSIQIDQEISTDQSSHSINNLGYSEFTLPTDRQNDKYANQSQKQPINNRIFDEDSCVEDSFNDYHQFINYQNVRQQEGQNSSHESFITNNYEFNDNQQDFLWAQQFDQVSNQQQDQYYYYHYQNQSSTQENQPNFYYQQLKNQEQTNQINQNCYSFYEQI
ncbi:hypothetical protein ABPG74_019148 [Tetrahymena malaccensis]